MKKKKIHKIVAVVVIITIIIKVSSVYVIKTKKENNEQTQVAENINKEEETKALPTIPETWDLTKVIPVLSSDDKYVPVPIGFTPSKAEGEQEVDKGFVIYEGIITQPEVADENAWTEEEAWQLSLDKNQFVWIPVENASSRIYESAGEKNPKKSRLWEFSNTGRSQITQSNGGGKRESGTLTLENYDSLRYLKNYLNLQDYSRDIWYKELQVEYDTAMKSIEKYGGFFIGRYETGNISSNTPVVRRMNTAIVNQNWYTMYSRMRNISSNVNIQTSMIWGNLWDETLQWLVDTGTKTYAEINSSTSWGNYRDATFTYRTNTSGSTATKNKNSNTIIPTGSAEYTKANNIYDLAGNVYDWTIEGNSSNYRYYRGGCFIDSSWKKSASTRNGWYPQGASASGYVGFRAYLYIK